MADSYEIPQKNATPDEIKQILEGAHVIAVVGLSDKPDRDSFRVSSYMKDQGYRIIPINPAISEILGEKSYARLEDVPEKIDVVDIFRKPETVPEIVDSAIKIGAKAIWMQEGVVHNESAEKARNAGLKVVMDRCMLKENRKLEIEKRL